MNFCPSCRSSRSCMPGSSLSHPRGGTIVIVRSSYRLAISHPNSSCTLQLAPPGRFNSEENHSRTCRRPCPRLRRFLGSGIRRASRGARVRLLHRRASWCNEGLRDAPCRSPRPALHRAQDRAPWSLRASRRHHQAHLPLIAAKKRTPRMLRGVFLMPVTCRPRLSRHHHRRRRHPADAAARNTA